jgi:hypothetical protein
MYSYFDYIGQPISASVRLGLVSVCGACARTGAEAESESDGEEDACAEPGGSQAADSEEAREYVHPSGKGYACYG